MTIWDAVKCGDVETIIEAIRVSPSLVNARNRENETLMFVAATNGQARVIEILVRLGSTDIDTVCPGAIDTPFFAALAWGHEDAVHSLWYLAAAVLEGLGKYVYDYNEEDAAEVRDRTYFQWSLFDRCMFYMSTKRITAIKFNKHWMRL